METSQATQPRTDWLTWLLNTIADIVFARVPGAKLAAQQRGVQSTRAHKQQYDALLKKREVLSNRIRQDEKALASVDAQIAKLKKQMNL